MMVLMALTRTMKGLILAGAASATALGGYVMVSRIRKSDGPRFKTEVINATPPPPPPAPEMPKTEIIIEE